MNGFWRTHHTLIEQRTAWRRRRMGACAGTLVSTILAVAIPLFLAHSSPPIGIDPGLPVGFIESMIFFDIVGLMFLARARRAQRQGLALNRDIRLARYRAEQFDEHTVAEIPKQIMRCVWQEIREAKHVPA